jgi:hypothetical protein
MNEFLFDLFLVIHFAGLAALLGGMLCQLGEPSRQITPLILIGAGVQLVTGIVLLLLTLEDANHLKVTVKLVITAVVLGLGLLRRGKVFAPPFYLTALVLTLTNIVLAVFW